MHHVSTSMYMDCVVGVFCLACGVWTHREKKWLARQVDRPSWHAEDFCPQPSKIFKINLDQPKKVKCSCVELIFQKEPIESPFFRSSSSSGASSSWSRATYGGSTPWDRQGFPGFFRNLLQNRQDFCWGRIISWHHVGSCWFAIFSQPPMERSGADSSWPVETATTKERRSKWWHLLPAPLVSGRPAPRLRWTWRWSMLVSGATDFFGNR